VTLPFAAFIAVFLAQRAGRDTRYAAGRRLRLRKLDSMIAWDGSKLVCTLRISPIMPFRPARLCRGHARVLAGPVCLCVYWHVGRCRSFRLDYWCRSCSLDASRR